MSQQRGDHSRHRTAAEWIARLNADDRTSADEAAFRQWSSHPDHAAQFERATALWDMVPGAAPLEAHTPVVSRRRLFSGAAALATIGVGGGFAFQAAYAGTRYATGIGQLQHVALDEGSTMLLDADTQVRVVATAQRRRLWLTRGRIALSVAATPIDFAIDAGRGTMHAHAGRFDLRRDSDDAVSFTAIDGMAQVAAPGLARALASGERLRAGAAAPAIDRPDLAATEAWRSGRAAFHDDTLAAVAAEANRYSATRLLIADRATAELRVSGMYRVGDNVALGRSLATLLSLRLRTVDGAVLLDGATIDDAKKISPSKVG
ncbi:FecR family protein [Sphingomonas sp. PB4P5]|uniref:FecR family protein n=1 Tax=Parasphingomonas puruogangriensis TaxID=3096155 RepID=UPI002FC80EF1